MCEDGDEYIDEKTRKRPKIDTSSSAMVTSEMTFTEAVGVIRPRLLPSMQNDAFTHAATQRVLSLQLNHVDFYKWLDDMINVEVRKLEANAKIAQAKADGIHSINKK